MLSHFSHVWLFATLWTGDHQASLSMGFSKQQYWRGLPWPPPGDLPNSGVKPTSLTSPALADRFFTTSATWEAQISYMNAYIRNLGKQYWWTYLQDRNGDADIENRLVDTTGEGQGTKQESSIDIYTLAMCEIDSGKLLHSTRNSACFSVMTGREGVQGEGR